MALERKEKQTLDQILGLFHGPWYLNSCTQNLTLFITRLSQNSTRQTRNVQHCLRAAIGITILVCWYILSEMSAVTSWVVSIWKFHLYKEGVDIVQLVLVNV